MAICDGKAVVRGLECSGETGNILVLNHVTIDLNFKFFCGSNSDDWFLYITTSLTHRQIIFDQKFLCFYVNMLNLNAVCFANYYTVALYIYIFLHFIISIKHFRCQKIKYACTQSNVFVYFTVKRTGS